MKLCVYCEVKKPLEDFYKLAASHDGLDRRCKPCAKSYRKNRKTGTPDFKTCTTCKQVKAKSDYTKSVNTSDGLNGHCKQCGADKREEVKNRPKVTPEVNRCSRCEETKKADDFYRTNYRVIGLTSWCKSCWGNYYVDNKEHINERNGEYKRNNRDKVLTYNRKLREKYPERYQEYSQRRLSIQRRVEHDSGVTVSAVRDIQGDNCAYCGRVLNFDSKKKGDPYDPTWATLDHVVPLSKEGTYTFDNILLACAHDNVSKGNRDLEDWLVSKEYEMIDSMS